MISRLLKILPVILLVLGNSPVSAQGSWVKADISTNQFLKSVCFVDSLYGWTAGDSGTIMHTVNGGNSWIRQNTQTVNEIPYVFFLDRNLGWASAINYSTTPYGTILLKTTNGGASWQSQPFPIENIFMSCILFTDSLHGWMGAKPNGIFKTTNGGSTWTQAVIDTSTLAFFPVLDIEFYNQKYGYASGGILDVAGVIWRTTNGGANWEAIDPAYAPADEVHKLHIFDSLHVMGSGGDPDFGYGVGMINTSDGGLTWIYNELPIQGNAYDLDFRNSTEVWAPLGTKRKLIYSLDGGVNWTPVATPDSTSIYDVTFPDSLHGYAVGKSGAFIRYIPPVIPGVVPAPARQERFSLDQNYPNPFNTATTIKFSLPDRDLQPGSINAPPAFPVQIYVSDLLGQEVATLVSSDCLPGRHAVTFAPAALPGGCYFYSLRLFTSGHYVRVAGPKKMIFLND